MSTLKALASLLHIPTNTDAELAAALLASLRATTDADEAARFRAMLFGEAS